MPAKLTKEDINEWLYNHGRSTRITGVYINARTKTDFIGACGHTWETTWASNKKSKTDLCKQCGDKIVGVRGSQVSIIDTYADKLKDKSVYALEPYTKAKVKILHKCKLCGIEFLARPDDVLRHNLQCPTCSGIKGAIKYKGKISEGLKNAALLEPLNIYVLKNDSCIKVGTSINVDKRILDLNSHGFNSVKVLDLKSNYWEARHLEHIIINKFPTYMWDGVKFGGYTELIDATYLDLVVKLIKESIGEANQ